MGGQLVGVPTKTQNYTRAAVQSAQTPTGNVRIPSSGNGMSSRGVILNDPALEDCVVGLPRVDYQTIRKIALGGSKGDVPVHFSFPVNKIWIASKDNAHLSDSLYFHFDRGWECRHRDIKSGGGPGRLKWGSSRNIF